MKQTAKKRYFDGRKGTIVCSKCFKDKSKDEVEQVKDGRSFKYVYGDCK